ncbi:MAG: hypothetical protein LQ351_002858 [Letrouitia transgressa]|nr:MAG: hypothetical protein LQ351_002858 [Letrouitia transgressa]
MVVNYSKWDALELSDDSDIEVHPNVDKRSFIRAKQNQIHQQRFERRHQITTLKYERIINDGLLLRIDRLLQSLRSHEARVRESKAGSSSDAEEPDEVVMQALMDCASVGEDFPPRPPEGVHTQEEGMKYSSMMGTLMDQVKEEVSKKGGADEESGGGSSEGWVKSYIQGVEGHQRKVRDLQAELEQKLAGLEKEEARKITSDSIHTGFDKSSVAKEKPPPPAKQKEKPKEAVEVLNPGALKKNNQTDSAGLSSGAEADVDEPGVTTDIKKAGAGADDDDEEDVQPTELGKRFAKIKKGDYKQCLQFIAENREVVAERETDGLLIEAFNAQMDKNSDYAKQCVHQALLLQYCRSLGKDGVGLFFKRITTPGHQAQKVFHDDVNSTYARIRSRCAELAKQEKSQPSSAEQIQLHAVDPNTTIHINIPQPHSTEEVEVKAREIFERFPPGLQRALESGSLDKVNEVLGKMSVEEAEEVVEKLGEGGMLSLEEGVIDGTTEEGRKKLRGLEEKAREENAQAERKVEELEVADPD